MGARGQTKIKNIRKSKCHSKSTSLGAGLDGTLNGFLSLGTSQSIRRISGQRSDSGSNGRWTLLENYAERRWRLSEE